jgi:hypothetical protein
MCLFKKKIIKNFKDSDMVFFLQILLNFDKHLNPSIFFKKKKNRRGILKILVGFNSKS